MPFRSYCILLDINSLEQCSVYAHEIDLVHVGKHEQYISVIRALNLNGVLNQPYQKTWWSALNMSMNAVL